MNLFRYIRGLFRRKRVTPQPFNEPEFEMVEIDISSRYDEGVSDGYKRTVWVERKKVSRPMSYYSTNTKPKDDE